MVLYTSDTLSGMLRSVGFKVEPLEYYDSGKNFHRAAWDQADGHITRCFGFTERKPDGRTIHQTSLIVDAYK
jgi:predicted SAM-dependent methyltransferase